nr:hypothetical protein [Nitrosopumilus sp.]
QEEFDKVAEQLKDLEEKNQELQFPNQFEPMEEQQKDIQQEMQQGQQQLQQNKNKKASQNQKNSSKKMEEMAESLEQAQASSEAEQTAEDLDALRELLENLIKLSFDQESLMEELKTTDINDPRYLQLSKDQRKMKDDAKMVEDSLFALSKRVPQIESVINKEIGLVNMNMENSLVNLQDRQTAQARSRQQFAMTSINNLALLLSEVMDALQQQMAQQMQGNQQCQKPGSKPSPSSGQLKQMQQQLSKQIQQLKGKMDGRTMPQGQISEELARLAAQQEAIRSELQRMSQENNKDGKGSLGDLEKVQQMMDENETDLLNKKITQETLRRQEDIITRLLEAENAERERDQDEKREAREGKDVLNRNQLAFEEYKRLKMKETELLKTVPPSLHPFYRKKVNEYFQNINN